MTKSMTIRMDSLIQVLAQALDMVEIAVLGATTNHGKRIAVLSAAMGKAFSMSEDEISDLVSCALLHDNALTEYLLLQSGREEDNPDISDHCLIGQRNVNILPFKGSVEGYILYHHERADGQGPFKLSEGAYPLAAEIIATADMLDLERPLEDVLPEDLPSLRVNILAETGSRFTKRAGQTLLDVLDMELLSSLRNENIIKTVRSKIPVWNMDMSDPSLVSVSEMVSRIIDNRSKSTGIHTQQIANRSMLMSDYYGYSIAEKNQLFLAAALHDIGKLAIPPEVLEKPGKLDENEFNIIKTHVAYTRSILSEMEGIEDITEWAANHHEKLDGSGYPLGKKAEELDFNSRLMACIDIYQAVSEARPYHPRRTHEQSMDVLYTMSKNGKIDSEIVKDMDKVMAPWSGKNVEI